MKKNHTRCNFITCTEHCTVFRSFVVKCLLNQNFFILSSAQQSDCSQPDYRKVRVRALQNKQKVRKYD